MREELLTIIEKNSRIGLKELAAMLGRSEIEVANEICDMEKEGIIGGYHTLINWEKTSLEKVTALIEVKVTPQRGQGFDKIAERIYNYPEVKAVYLISGGYDLLVTLEEKSLKEISNFVTDKLSTLDRVLSTATHFVLKKYKDHGTIMNKANNEEEREIITP
jgi:DNA-binding Lrp family transcriptional regulator